MGMQTRDAVGHPAGTYGPAPTFAAQTGWTITADTNCTDEAGTVATTAASSTAAGEVTTVAFANQYDAVPRAVIVSGPLGAYASAVTAAGFNLNTSSTSSATNNTAYTFYYDVVTAQR